MSKEPDGGYNEEEEQHRNHDSARSPALVGWAARFGIDDLARHFLSDL
jgi:hypothetical protein